MTAMELARKFHYYYENLAPTYGYETRITTKKFEAESSNGKLMIAVCELILIDHLAAMKEKDRQNAPILRDKNELIETLYLTIKEKDGEILMLRRQAKIAEDLLSADHKEIERLRKDIAAKAEQIDILNRFNNNQALEISDLKRNGVKAGEEIKYLRGRIVDQADNQVEITQLEGESAYFRHELNDLLKSLTLKKTRELSDAKAKIEQLGAALKEIVDPISCMRKRLQEGDSLNGQMAIQLSQDHNFLKSIAAEALLEKP